MRALLFGLSLVLYTVSVFTAVPTFDSKCFDYTDSVFDSYKASLYDFAIKTLVKADTMQKSHFAISPYSMWLTLSGIAEGSEGAARRELFKFLNLPEDVCTRQQFYKIASSRFANTEDIHFAYERLLLLNEGVTVKPDWKDFVTKSSLLDVASKATKTRRGNSNIKDTVSYTGLWSTGFSDAEIVKSPFYNEKGDKIGSVDLMKTKKRVKIGYGKNLLSDIIEIDIGKEGNYSLLIAKLKDKADIPSVVSRMTAASPKEIIESLEYTVEPIDISIPKFTLETENNIESLAKSFGVKALWAKAENTRLISDPPAFPGNYYQKVTVTFGNEGVEPAPIIEKSKAEKEFIANKPFFYVLVDKETYSGLILGVFSVPTYKDC